MDILCGEHFVLCIVVKNFSVVKEEIIDDGALLPSYNGRVVTWVRLILNDTVLKNVIIDSQGHQY